MENATVVSADGNGQPRLPRGPHALPQEVVVAHQRERILDATAGVMADLGFAEFTVKDVVTRAGVSRRTFYQLFQDKLDCVFAAHQRAVGRLSREIVRGCASETGWPEKVKAGIAASLGFAAESPAEAQLIVCSCHTASEPKLAKQGNDAHDKLAALLRAGRARLGGSRTPPDLTEEAVVGAAMSVVGARLMAGEAEALPALCPELAQLVLAPYIGDRKARRVADA